MIQTSVLIAGAPFGRRVYADRFDRRGSDAVPVALGRTRRRAPFQRIFG
jgi:hypothetical protein